MRRRRRAGELLPADDRMSGASRHQDSRRVLRGTLWVTHRRGHRDRVGALLLIPMLRLGEQVPVGIELGIVLGVVEGVVVGD